MPETIAREKFSCPACGAAAEWNPAKQSLVCPFCGTTSPAQIELDAVGEQVIKEHDLVAAIRSIPDDKRGWQAKKTSVKCQSCQAISVFDAERVGQNCNFCGAAALVPYDEIKEAFRPESLLQFTVTETEVRDNIRKWYGSRWFAPNKLKNAALTDTVKGVYIPYWTFDANVHADWTAESGYYYYETHTFKDSQGRQSTRNVRKTRWQWSSGNLDHIFDDELVPASLGVQPNLLRKVEPFPTNKLTPYKAGFLSGWVVERYQIDLVSAAQHAREVMDQKITTLCARQVPGDTHRNLDVNTDYSQQTFKHILVPVWLLTYQFGRRNFQVVVNGFTGEIAGKHPKSWAKILFAVVTGIAIAGLIAFLVSSQ